MKTSKELLQEKGVNEVYAICSIETLALLMRSNSTVSKIYPEEYKVPTLISEDPEESEKTFSQEANLMLEDRRMAMASIAVGIDYFASVFFENLHKNGMPTLSEEERKQLLEQDEEYLMGSILSSVTIVMAALERRVKDGSPLLKKLNWSYKSVMSRANEIATLCNDDFEKLVKESPDYDPMQIRMTALVESISQILCIVSVFEVAKTLDTTPELVYEVGYKESACSLLEIMMTIGVQFLKEKIIHDFGEDFYNNVDALSKEEAEAASK